MILLQVHSRRVTLHMEVKGTPQEPMLYRNKCCEVAMILSHLLLKAKLCVTSQFTWGQGISPDAMRYRNRMNKVVVQRATVKQTSYQYVHMHS